MRFAAAIRVCIVAVGAVIIIAVLAVAVLFGGKVGAQCES